MTEEHKAKLAAARQQARQARMDADKAQNDLAQDMLEEQLQAEELGANSAKRMQQQTIAQVIQAESGLDEALDFIEESISQGTAEGGNRRLEVPIKTIQTEAERDQEFLKLVREERARQRRATMWNGAGDGNELGSVSVYACERAPDPTRVLGAGGRSLLRDNEVGAFISLEDSDGNESMENVTHARARGARFVRGEDGRVIRNALGVFVAYDKRESAAYLARINADHYTEDLILAENKRPGVAIGRGLFANPATEQDLNWIEKHQEAEESGTNRVRPRNGQWQMSHALMGDSGGMTEREQRQVIGKGIEEALGAG